MALETYGSDGMVEAPNDIQDLSACLYCVLFVFLLHVKGLKSTVVLDTVAIKMYLCLLRRCS